MSDPVMDALVKADGDYTDPDFITELSVWSIQNAMRPRDEFDIDVHPETFRGKMLAYYDAMDGLSATRRGRFLMWIGHKLGHFRAFGASRTHESD